jgi:hypothetical protein
LEELPKLTPGERKAVRRRLWGQEADRQQLDQVTATAEIVFQEIDRREAEDADAR